MSLFRCPVCGGPLVREERAYRCEKGHSYDLAREGYTYLLPPNQPPATTRVWPPHGGNSCPKGIMLCS